MSRILPLVCCALLFAACGGGPPAGTVWPGDFETPRDQVERATGGAAPCIEPDACVLLVAAVSPCALVHLEDVMDGDSSAPDTPVIDWTN